MIDFIWRLPNFTNKISHIFLVTSKLFTGRKSLWIIYIGDICSETVGDSNMQQYLPWPPWAARQEIEIILIAKVSKESDITS